MKTYARHTRQRFGLFWIEGDGINPKTMQKTRSLCLFIPLFPWYGWTYSFTTDTAFRGWYIWSLRFNVSVEVRVCRAELTFASLSMADYCAHN